MIFNSDKLGYREAQLSNFDCLEQVQILREYVALKDNLLQN